MGRPIHARTRAAAELFAQRELKTEVVLRRPTLAEALKVKERLNHDFEAVADAVVVQTPDQGKQYLLGVLDEARTRSLNQESAVTTAVGLIPVVGPFTAAILATADIARAGVPLLKATVKGEATDPMDRAVLRMGLKHLTLSSASIVSHGAAHHLVAAAELGFIAKDGVEGQPLGLDRKALKSVLQATFKVGHHDPATPVEDLRVIVVEVS